MKKVIYTLFVAGVLITSCKKNDPTPEPLPVPTPEPKYTVPTTYTFDNVNYSGQTYRLSMTDELMEYIESANTPNTVLDAVKMKNMYANSNAPFADNTLNTSGKQLKNKVYSDAQPIIETYFDTLAHISQSTVSGSNGTAGVVTSTDGSKKYLLTKTGFDYAERVEKSLMGALMYYQICEVYLSESQIGNSVDNTNVVAGEGTAMEHHWDEAFGYFGAATDFPANTSGLKYWAKYANARNAVLQCNKKLMDAFITGRAAITGKDMATKDAQVIIIKTELERVAVATAISYLNRAKSSFSDDAVRNHVLSEAYTLIDGLRYNSAKKITNEQIEEIKNYIGSNFYTVSTTGLDNAKNKLSTIYGMDSIKDSL